jgi:hypothetical protein
MDEGKQGNRGVRRFSDLSHVEESDQRALHCSAQDKRLRRIVFSESVSTHPAGA